MITILFLSVLVNIFDAISDGLYDNTKRISSSIFENLYKIIGIILVVIITYNLTTGNISIPIIKLILGFIFIRFLVFDYTYNIIRKLPVFELGTTKLYDRLLNKVPFHFILFVKVVCGTVGTCFLLGLH